MLTRRGWLVALGSVAFLAAGRLLGIPELYAFATASLLLPVACLVYVRAARFSLQAARVLRPPRVHAGSTARVELALRNQGERNTPVLAARDPFDEGRRWARFLVAPLGPGETARAAYRLPTDHRGVFSLGPLELSLTDPFGMATVAFEAAAEASLTVFPRVDPIPPMPHAAGHDPTSGVAQRNHLGLQGEEFYALRPYVQGDDLRRVHWPSTARRDELQIRQDEVPWQGRATVVVDLRRHMHSPESLEDALSAAASIVVATVSRRSLIRLVTTEGVDSGFGSGHVHVEAILERLAVAQAEPKGHLPSVLARLRNDGNGGSIALITTSRCTPADIGALGRLKGRYGRVALVWLGQHAGDAAPAGFGGKVVAVHAQRPFAQAWAETFPRPGHTGLPAPVTSSFSGTTS